MTTAEIIGFPSTTASSSDVLLIKYNSYQEFYPFLYNSNNGNDSHKVWDKSIVIIANKVFRKVYISPYINKEYVNVTMLSGHYEFLVYKNIIKPLLDYNISPHFIRYYRIVENLPVKDYIKELTTLDNKISEASILRNIGYLYASEKNRPSINVPFTITSDYTFYNNIKNNFKINYIDMMAIDTNNTIDFSTYIKTYFPNNKFIPKYQISEMFVIYFQVLQALYALYLSRTCHNDMRAGNIWITRRSKRVKVQYNINGKVYKINTDICVRIFDFDRAYSEKLGDNPLLNGKSCNIDSQCNKLISFKDYIKFNCYINFYLSQKNIPNLDKILPLNKYLDQFYTESCFLTSSKSKISDTEYDKVTGLIISQLAGDSLPTNTQKRTTNKKGFIENILDFIKISKSSRQKTIRKEDDIYPLLLDYFYSKIDEINKYKTTSGDFEYTCNKNFFSNGNLVQKDYNCCETT